MCVANITYIKDMYLYNYSFLISFTFSELIELMPEDSKDIALVIENSQSNIQLYKLIFKDVEFEVVYTNSLDEAKQQILNTPIKVIICELVNLGGDAISFFEKMELEYPSIKKILVTDYIEPLLLSRAIQNGRIFNYLAKPVDPDRIKVAIYSAFKQFNLAQENNELIDHLKTKNQELEQLFLDLREEEEKFRNVFNAKPDPAFIINNEGWILHSNPKAQKLCVHANGSNLFDLTSPLDKIKIQTYVEAIMLGVKPAIEVEMEDNSCNCFRQSIIEGYPIKFKGIQAFMISFNNISERKEMQKEVMRTIIQTEEKERRRFAQELHDGVGPLLSTAKLYLQWFNKPASKMDKGVIISKIEETLEETLISIREISNNISPNTLVTFGLNTALKTFINRIKNASAIQFKYKNSLNVRLNEQLEVTIYRLLCELINNSIKYAEARKINVEISQNSTVNINYCDDGKGFNVAEAMDSRKGMGLMNMSTRVQSLGGQYVINSSPGMGTKVSVKLLKE